MRPVQDESSKQKEKSTCQIKMETQLVGTSSVGFDDCVKRALERAQKTLRHVRWFEVEEQRGRITADGVEYQVTIEVGFALEDTL